MSDPLHETELDRARFPEFRDRILAHDAAGPGDHAPRLLPGGVRWRLPRPRARWTVSFDRVLLGRRSQRRLSPQLPSREVLARLLLLSHAVHAAQGVGPTPSAGGLQALELYLAAWDPQAWLPAGCYHYDRVEHALVRLQEGDTREAWRERLPSLDQFEGGALLWVLVGDLARIGPKYGERGARFALLEAGHLMQNLCLASQSLGLCTLPLGGLLEGEAARRLLLPRSDRVLYAGALGAPV
ncbi:MAG: SagB/ThcOx family dehydrogenase [Planctomycetota bacterium]